MEKLIFIEARRYFKAYVPIENDSTKHLKIVVEYFEGGVNYFSEANNPRAYRLSIRPVELGDHSETFILIGDHKQAGGFVNIELAKRYSAKRLTELAEIIDKRINEIYEAWKADNVTALRELAKAA